MISVLRCWAEASGRGGGGMSDEPLLGHSTDGEASGSADSFCGPPSGSDGE